jgi:broad specificity phosphatase PhoE
MKPKRIILVRHGESEGNINKKVYNHKPDYALNLTPKGIEQARAFGAKLIEICGGKKPLGIYASPFYRTRQTAKFISESFDNNIAFYKEDPRLREQEWSTQLRSDPKEQDEVNRDNYGKFYYRFSNGESCADVYDRLSTFADTFNRDFEKDDFPENVLIVTHGMTKRVFLMRWFHWSVEFFESVRNPENCGHYVLELQKDNKYKLITKIKRHARRLSKF